MASKPTKPKTNGVGRPRATVKLPKGEFTFRQLCILNGALTADGKTPKKGEKRMVPLTLRNYLKRDNKKGSRSEVVRIKDKFGKSESETGLGKPPFMYRTRSANVTVKAKTKTPRTPKAATPPASAVTVAVSIPAPVTPAPVITTLTPALTPA